MAFQCLAARDSSALLLLDLAGFSFPRPLPSEELDDLVALEDVNEKCFVKVVIYRGLDSMCGLNVHLPLKDISLTLPALFFVGLLAARPSSASGSASFWTSAASICCRVLYNRRAPRAGNKNGGGIGRASSINVVQLECEVAALDEGRVELWVDVNKFKACQIFAWHAFLESLQVQNSSRVSIKPS